MAQFFDLLESVLVPVGVLYVIFYFTYMIIRVLAQRRERRILAERMAENPDLVIPSLDGEMVKRANPYGWVKPAGLIIGLGIAFFLCSLISPSIGDAFDTAQTFMAISLMLIFGGMGMLGGFFLERHLRKSDGK